MAHDFTIGPLDRLHQNWVDELGPAWKGYELAKTMQGIDDIAPSRDAKVRGRLFGGIGDKIQDIFEQVG